MSNNRVENRGRTDIFVKEHITPSKSYNDIISGEYLKYFVDLDFSNHFPNAVCEMLGIRFDPKNKIPLHQEARDKLVKKLPKLTYIPRFANDPNFIEHLTSTDNQNIDNWMYSRYSARGSGGKGDKKSSGKDTIYRLCLGLFTGNDGIKRTEEFFLKACMFPPFNPKRLEDVVFYYCIKYHKDINYVYQIIDTIILRENIKICNSSVTVESGAKMEKIKDENMLIKYIEDHCCIDNELEYRKALALIADLNDKLADQKIGIGLKSTFPTYSRDKKTSVNKNNKRAKFEYSWINIESMLRNKFKFNDTEIQCVYAALDDIIDTFPVFQSNSPIQNYDGDKPELIRKTLMVRWLMSYFADALKGEDAIKIYDDCCDRLDDTLFECGFMQTYSLNPFDLLILICASKAAYCCSQNQDYANPLCDIIEHLFSPFPFSKN